jgi:hypothetical protein
MILYCADHDVRFDTDADTETHRFCHGTDGELLSTPRSWAPEVIADDSGKFCGNGLRFATKEESDVWVRDLSMRWLLVRETRSVPTDDPVTDKLEKSADGTWVQSRVA